MQAILITLASAIILAIVAAFAAPFVVDWNAWRATFETEAGRVIGVPVLIRGGIEAELLPVPRLVLRQVSVGADAISTGGTFDEVRADLSLGALLRGELEAQGLTLVRPRLRLVLDSAGRVALPTGAGSPAGLSITRLSVENGSLQILDRGADRELNVTGLDLKGEARSLSGPFRLEGEMEAGGRRQGVRLSLGKMGADPARLRLIVDDRARALALDLDGTFRLDQGTARYDGRASLIRRATGAQDEGWRVVASIKASPEAVVAETLDLTLGDEARAAQLSGSARLMLGRALGLDAVLNARALDADPLLRGAAAGRTPAELAGDLAAAFTALDPPPLPVRIGVGIDQLTLGGTVVREARIDLAGDASAWRLDMAEARLPGQALIRLTGAPAAARTSSSFLGEALFAAEDPATFLRWAAPRAPAEAVQAVKGPVRLSGRIAITETAVSVGNLEASFGTAKASGSASYLAGSPARLDIALMLDGFDLDPLLGAARVALASGLPVTGDIALSGRDLTLSGLPLGALAVTASAEGEGWKLSRLSLDDLAGLRLEGQGTFTRLTSPVTGRVDMTVSGARAQGLEPVARIVAGGAAADMVHRLLPVAAPVQLTAFAQWREDGSRTLRTEGQLGQIRGSLAVRHGGTAEPLRADLSVAAEDGARVLEAAGLGGLRSGQGPGQLDLSVRGGSGSADSTLEGRLTLGDAVLEGQGTLRDAGQGVQPTLALRLTGGDLSRIFAAAAAAEAGPLPASLAFTLRPEAGRWRLEDLKGTVAGAPVSGAIGVEPGAVPRLTGRLDLEEASVARLIGLWGARSEGPDTGAGVWSAARFALGSGPAVTADMRLQARRLGLADNYRLTDAGLRLIAGGSSLELRDLSGGFGGGRLAGSLLLHRRPDTLAAEGHLALTDVDGAALLAPLAPKAAPRGRVTLILDLLGSGRSPLLLVQSLVGQGTLAVKNLEIAAADPSAIAAVLAATVTGAPPDERRTAQMLDRALARGPLRLAAVESTLGVVNGVVRVSPARTQVGQERATLSASFDLARLTLEASLELEAAIVAGAAPGGAITWRGPVAAPERQVTATALTAVIAMRAIERETRRLEERQGGDGGIAAPSAGMPTDPPAAPPVPAGAGQGAGRAPAQAAPAPAAPAAPRAPPREVESRAPPLPPPLDIGPSVRPRAAKPVPQGGVGGSDFMPYAPPGWGDVYRPPGLVPGQ